MSTLSTHRRVLRQQESIARFTPIDFKHHFFLPFANLMSEGFQCLLFVTNYLKLTGITQQSFPVVQEFQRRQLALLLFLWDAHSKHGDQLTGRLVLTEEEDSLTQLVTWEQL
jgi:hypothetical protein